MPTFHPVSRRTALQGFAATLLLATHACSRPSRPASDRPIERVVSISPNTTEAVFALGAGVRLVGRSRYCNYPPGVERLTSIGGYVDPSLEAILALRPDLVTGARGPSGRTLVDRLESRGIDTYFPSTETIEEILEMVVGLARCLDLQDAGAQLSGRIRGRLEAIDRVVRDAPRPRVLLVFGTSPIVVAGPGSFADEMLRCAGCDNAMREGTRYPSVGLETVIGMDPDWVIDTSSMTGEGTPSISAEPGWNTLRAIREGRVARILDDAVLRPGPRIADGVAHLAKVVHPGLVLP